MTLLDSFEAERGHLLSVGYRLTGSVADAEDAVQEAWIRLSGVDTEAIRDLRGWLTTVVGRLCVDRLRSAASRRETYVGQWLPEPIVTPLAPSGDAADPIDAVVQHEDNRLAAMVVLDALSPDQRVAFVLHDGFGVPFDEIAELLNTNAAAARQAASRARKSVAQLPDPAPGPEHDEAVGRLMAALASGDMDAVVAALHPDIRLTGDSNGKVKTAVNVIDGPNNVARFVFGLMRMYGADRLLAMEPVRVNGALGLNTFGTTGDDQHRPLAPRVTGFTVRDGLVWAAYDFANPDKRQGFRLGPPDHS